MCPTLAGEASGGRPTASRTEPMRAFRVTCSAVVLVVASCRGRGADDSAPADSPRAVTGPGVEDSVRMLEQA